jgi:hypothetical protein
VKFPLLVVHRASSVSVADGFASSLNRDAQHQDCGKNPFSHGLFWDETLLIFDGWILQQKRAVVPANRRRIHKNRFILSQIVKG